MASLKVRKGNDLMIFLNDGTSYKSVAFATQHQISTTLETDTIQTKDSGYDGAELPKNITFEITSDNLYLDAEYSTLYDKMLAKEYVDVIWGVAKDGSESGATTEEGLTSTDSIDSSTKYWTYDSEKTYYGGKCLITSFSVSSSAGENATYSITLKGSGTPKKSYGA